MFKFIKKLFKKKEPEEDPNIIIEEEEKAKQEIIYTIDKYGALKEKQPDNTQGKNKSFNNKEASNA